MTCPNCGHTHHEVIDKRTSGNDIYRRRQCHQCRHKWTTKEIMADELKALRKMAKVTR